MGPQKPSRLNKDGNRPELPSLSRPLVDQRNRLLRALRSRPSADLCGQSVDGIRSRVNRHLTSARSDIIANRQIDVWEIAWVWAYPVKDKAEIGVLEDDLFHAFNAKSALMNGKVPKPLAIRARPPDPSQTVQVMSDPEIAEKKDPALRLPRQAEHYSQIVGHFLAVRTQGK
jgi:hypothetical protein